MPALRDFLLRHRVLTLWLVAAALCMKMVVPAGFMVASEAKVLTIRICVDSVDSAGIAHIVVPMKGEAAKPGKGECAFASLAMAATGGADMALLALALAFLVALGLAPAPAPRPRHPQRLRPPLRAPPASF